jgi:hypothetical protein
MPLKFGAKVRLIYGILKGMDLLYEKVMQI